MHHGGLHYWMALMDVILMDGIIGRLADVQGIAVQGLRQYSVIDQLL
jgi:hypothetical protein